MSRAPDLVALSLRVLLLGLLAGCALSACASHPVPELQLAASLEAIDAASRRTIPEAGAELARARQKMALARKLAADGQGEPSRWLAEQAQVDAQLAQARTQALLAARDAEGWEASRDRVRERVAAAGFVRESRR